MAINWFPGHMNKARKKISEAMPDIDLVIEVLDARLPFSSTNPLVNELRGDKPTIKVLNKADLADPATTNAWVSHFSEQAHTQALPLVAEDRKQVKQLIALAKKVGQGQLEKNRAVRVMIMGIPNVGKSTLINALAGRYIARTGNEPAVTKANQMIDLKNGIVLSDTPGILWPRFENELSGYRLAASGAVKDTAIEYTDVAMFALDYLRTAYEKELTTRFKLKDTPENAEQLLNTIAAKRGCLRAGGIVDLHKASEIVLHELRAGKIGRISMETPEMIQVESEEIERLKAEAAAAREAAAKEESRGKRHHKEE
ncbi:MAG: ribosome biogenesis GTPase YlqF [Oceanospirillaceae bacterium]|jgi:ribosome biogenesis GTPase A|uniref:ribosome biogenesis GTPase YlqF n=1 Tax=unclassified Thalassolituus TaxID=2624967 RepID=UPI000B66B3A1|nr:MULTISPECIES: ribosome biogenesis GTPase YlqF [unclassified Thalassolituus]MAE34328.1 ribosome biogenesis GTPase YlqF [Oceanospirillaceae bacterium]OUX64880.1 MAG: ribosome biogenesis GTPase YlqF [Oceanospirillaceae bacterium TMED276]MBN56352.1 ribosome biogenesis GTPase YlqF [Oceanospirillaceae bacterium]MDQ4422615.1 ribosome biogenesis GTPase YlqF [Thalassolituus sp.]MDQ4426470.1 ribosome biogenesis GTPase YlqF [Thalassolituus sp.]|tara:strand:- start:5584 stop:6522 length:939 start_codon:yes stop_codon:yes gene_type:complete